MRKDEVKIVKRFGEAMQEKLDERASKGRLRWREKSFKELIQMLESEVEELKEEIGKDKKEARRETADIANFAMFIWDKLRG